MRTRVVFALAAPALVLPFEVLQAAVLLRMGSLDLHEWLALSIANGVLLVGACALAADIPLADRFGRAVLVGIGVPLLLPGPTVADSLAQAAYVLTPHVLPSVLLLLMLGSAEAGIYLLATRPRPTT